MSGTGLWYADGIRFSCRRCGRCCRDHGVESYVFLHRGDVEALAAHLGMDEQAVAAAYLVDVEGFLCLANHDGDCIFFDPGKGCRVYRARPVQCRAWPFWPENLERWAWRNEVEPLCPGVGRGRLHTLSDIRRALASLRTAPLLTTGPAKA